MSQRSVKKYFSQVPTSSSQNQNQEGNTNNVEGSIHSQEFDIDSLKVDPAERPKILSFHPNDRDMIRRAYIQKGAFQPQNHNFPQSNFSKSNEKPSMRRFNHEWFDSYVWLEYSVIADAAYCLYCYLFNDSKMHQGGGKVFSESGFKSWNKNTTAIDQHEQSVFHIQSKRKCDDLMKQCYDGASNMQGDIKGLKRLIMQESRSAHSIHCFAHQLQLTLVAVSKKCVQVGELVLLVSNILNVLGGSFKRMDAFRESQREKVKEALDIGELKTGRGLNQELGLSKACDTRWGSHYKCFTNFISVFDVVIDVLDTIVDDARSQDEKAKATGYLRACQTFDVAFILHLMKEVLGYTDVLNNALQKKEQDIANAMLLVDVAKRRLQLLRDNGWTDLIKEVTSFCDKHSILIPTFDEPYVNSGRSRRRATEYTVLHHYHVEVFSQIIDWQLQELNDRFGEVTTDLLHGVACLNPINLFSSFDIGKIMRMAELYPDDFDEHRLKSLQNQLESYIIDVRDVDERFSNLNGLCELARKFIETKKRSTYPLVFHLVKLALLLPVATASVERAFSAMKFIKNDLRSRMGDEFFGGCMVPYLEKDVFNNVSNDAIIKTFQEMKTRRVHL